MWKFLYGRMVRMVLSTQQDKLFLLFVADEWETNRKEKPFFCLLFLMEFPEASGFLLGQGSYRVAAAECVCPASDFGSGSDNGGDVGLLVLCSFTVSLGSQLTTKQQCFQYQQPRWHSGHGS